MEDNYILIAGIAGAILSPIVTALGLFFQYRKDRKKNDALSDKIAADAEKIEAETKLLNHQADKDTINFWIGMVETLRKEVNSLTELSRQNGGEIAVLTAKLRQSDKEKEELAKQKEDLVKEVQELREEVETLRKQIKGE